MSPDHHTPVRRWLLTVGVAQYPSAAGLIDLPGAVTDVQRVHDILSDGVAVPFAGVSPLYNGAATRHAIRGALRRLANEAHACDQVVFYFAGHGGVRQGGPDPLTDGRTRYLLPYDASPSDGSDRWISSQELADWLRPIEASLVVVLDCCYAGAFGGVFARALDGLHSPNWCVIAAARPFQTAAEGDAGGLFTQLWCDALEGGRGVHRTPDGWVSAYASYDAASDHLPPSVAGVPLRQRPQYATNTRGPIYLTHQRLDGRRAGTPAGCAAPLEPFLGRGPDLNLLCDLLDRPCGPGQRVVTVRGWAGVGKTVVTQALAHDPRLAGRYPDGFVWAVAGRPDADSAERILSDWSVQLGLGSPPAGCPAREVRAALNSAASGRQMLLLVDDVRDPSLVEEVRVGGPGCAVVITTRRTDVAHALSRADANVYTLQALAPADACELLRLRVPRERWNPVAAAELLRAVGHLPLAIEVIGRELVAGLLGKTDDRASRLARPRALLGLRPPPGADAKTVRDVLAAGFDPPHPCSPALLQRLAAAPRGSRFRVDARTPVDEAGLEALVAVGLLEQSSVGWFGTHPLVHDLFNELVARSTGNQVRTTVAAAGHWLGKGLGHFLPLGPDVAAAAEMVIASASHMAVGGAGADRGLTPVSGHLRIGELGLQPSTAARLLGMGIERVEQLFPRADEVRATLGILELAELVRALRERNLDLPGGAAEPPRENYRPPPSTNNGDEPA